MSFVQNLLGINGGGGANATFGGASLINPGIQPGQSETAYGQSQSGIQQQQAFLNQLASQNGISNQNSVFQQQQDLANQLQGVANGTGPNPAAAQLAQTTGANVANQAALMAGQRGAASNVGLLARQAGQQGGAIQQQAAGQGATMAAQQQLAGMQALQSQQNALASTAGTQVQNQGSALAGLNQTTQNEQQNINNAVAQYNNAQVGSTTSQNNANATMAAGAQKGQQGFVGGILNGASSMMGGMAHGGEVPSFDDGGAVTSETGGPKSSFGKFLAGFSANNQNADQTNPVNGGANSSADSGAKALNTAGNSIGKGIGNLVGGGSSTGVAEGAADVSGAASGVDIGALAGLLSKGGEVQNFDGGGGVMSMVGKVLPLLALLDKGGAVKKAVIGENLAAQGKMVPGKAKVKGDSLENDTVPARLSPKEIVIPRSIAMSPNAPELAAKFVAAVKAKQGFKKAA